VKTIRFKTQLLPIINQTGFTNRLALPVRRGGEVRGINLAGGAALI
jgi:hypothetical protein